MALHLVKNTSHPGAQQKNHRVAVIGGGISGLSAAYALRDSAQVTLFEANDYVGGHTNTVDVTLEGIQYPVDTGFLVYNERTYPNLIKLFAELGVETAKTDMGFGVSLPELDIEWSGTNLNTVFAQRRNLLRPKFLWMLRDILRFNEHTTRLATERSSGSHAETLNMALGDFLEKHRYGAPFRDWYLLPMAAAIWSCPTRQMLDYPLDTFVRFCHNHGLLQVNNRPQWYTVKAGARNYVHKILPHIDRVLTQCPVQSITIEHGKPTVTTRHGAEQFDAVVMACHSDEAVSLLPESHSEQKQLLSKIRYQDNIAYLHTDTSLMPKNPLVWSAWNYLSDVTNPQPSVSVTYWLNRLQPVPFKTPVLVTLNPIKAPNPERVIKTLQYAHPVFDSAAIEAQTRLPSVQGKDQVFFAGAWAGYGFHEDGHKAGLRAAALVQESLEQTPHTDTQSAVA